MYGEAVVHFLSFVISALNGQLHVPAALSLSSHTRALSFSTHIRAGSVGHRTALDIVENRKMSYWWDWNPGPHP